MGLKKATLTQDLNTRIKAKYKQEDRDGSYMLLSGS